MAFPTVERTSGPKATIAAPALQAFAVAPVVGSIVVLLITVGLAAMAFGALAGVAGGRRAKPHHVRARR